MSLKKAAVLIMIVSISFLTIAATKDTKTAGAVESSMKNMKKPEKEMEKLARSKLFKDRRFASAALQIAREAQKMANIKHADKKFNDLSKEMLEYSNKLLAAIKKQDYADIEEFYKDVRSICFDCHDVYKDL